MTLVTDYTVAVSLKNPYINCQRKAHSTRLSIQFICARHPKKSLGDITSDITSDMVTQFRRKIVLMEESLNEVITLFFAPVRWDVLNSRNITDDNYLLAFVNLTMVTSSRTN
jgi:hypothetical protein